MSSILTLLYGITKLFCNSYAIGIVDSPIKSVARLPPRRMDSSGDGEMGARDQVKEGLTPRCCTVTLPAGTADRRYRKVWAAPRRRCSPATERAGRDSDGLPCRR